MTKELIRKALTKPAPKVGNGTVEDLRPSSPYQPSLSDKHKEIIGLWKDIDEKSSKGWGAGGVSKEVTTPHADFLTFEYLVKNYRDDMQAEVQRQVQSGDDFKSSNEVVKPRQIKTN